MAIRRGLGSRQGQGYKNLVPYDKVIHSLNAKGVHTTLFPKGGKHQKQGKQPIPEKKDILSFLSGKGHRNDFGSIPTPQKKGLIRELARKVAQGVDYAIEWEKQHLPQQQEWVKKEYHKAKEELQKVGKSVEEGKKKWQEEHKKDVDDVRDELDTNDDGIQDIPLYELEDVNKGIVQQLDTIDLDNSGIPDHNEDGFLNMPKQPESTPEPQPEPVPDIDFEPMEMEMEISEEPIYKNKVYLPLPVLNPKEDYGSLLHPEQDIPIPTHKESFREKAGKLVKKEFAIAKEKAGEGIGKVKTYIKGRQLEKDFIKQMPDSQLRELGVREGSGGGILSSFGFGGGSKSLNKYEKELLRRTEERIKLDNAIQMAKEKARAEVKQKLEKKSSGAGDFISDFINPFGKKEGEKK